MALARSHGVVTYPARFLLVLAANPCPCAKPARDCTCAPAARRRYQQRLSGPLLDRVDVRVQVDPVPHGELFDAAPARETSAAVAARVAAARGAAASRWAGTPWRVNGDVPGPALRSSRWRLPRTVLAAAERHLERGQLSARGFDRVLRLAWTLADLAGSESPTADDIAEALFLRTGFAPGCAA